MTEDAAARARLLLPVLFDLEAEPVMLVAMEVDVATHRFGGTLHRCGADHVGVDDAVVVLRARDVDAIVRRGKRAIRHRRGGAGGITEHLADAEHTGRAATVALVLERPVVERRIQPESPARSAAADRHRRGDARRDPAMAPTREGVQHAVIGIPVGHRHQYQLTGMLPASGLDGRGIAGRRTGAQGQQYGAGNQTRTESAWESHADNSPRGKVTIMARASAGCVRDWPARWRHDDRALRTAARTRHRADAAAPIDRAAAGCTAARRAPRPPAPDPPACATDWAYAGSPRSACRGAHGNSG